MAMLNENLRLAFKFNANGFPAFAGMTKMEKSLSTGFAEA
jgi:hypothetical protein